MVKTVKIFDKEYPLYEEENSVSFKDYLPDFFKDMKSFSTEVYYDKMIEMYPQFKNKWWKKKPTEKEIENYFVEKYGIVALDGANSVPPVERKLGVKIGGGYKYPEGMKDIEYHAFCLNVRGFLTHFKERAPSDIKDAYMYAWHELHFPKEKMMPILQQEYKKLVELNPALEKINLDINNPIHLTYFSAGVTYDFPVADIQLFIDGKRGRDERERVEKELSDIGLDAKDFGWVLSSETIKNIDKALKEKNRIKDVGHDINDSMGNSIKSSKERVADKLSQWGIEEGSYMIITPEDNAYVGLSGSNVKSASSYFENGAKEVADKASKVVYGENNGLVGAYFDDGVYVVSNNVKLRDVLSREAVDVGLGVMLSNGESFKIANGNDNSILNHKWNLTKDTGEEVNKIFKQKQEQHDEVLDIKEQKENAVTGAEKLSNTVQKLCEFADRHDNTGALKERLVTTFIKDDEKLNTLEFWGGCAKDFAKGSSAGQDNFVKELGKIGINTVKDIKDNKENTQYVAVKNRCKEETSVEGMVKTAKVCANRSKISVNTKTTDRISM